MEIPKVKMAKMVQMEPCHSSLEATAETEQTVAAQALGAGEETAETDTVGTLQH